MRRGRATYGTQTFDQHLFQLLGEGRITQPDALRFANNPDELALRLSGLGSDDE
jgi:twitching motility protein PilT